MPAPVVNAKNRMYSLSIIAGKFPRYYMGEAFKGERRTCNPEGHVWVAPRYLPFDSGRPLITLYKQRNGGDAAAYFDGLEKLSNGATSKLRMFRGGFCGTCGMKKKVP